MRNKVIFFIVHLTFFSCASNEKKSWDEALMQEDHPHKVSTEYRKPVIKPITIIDLEEENADSFIQPLNSKQSSIKKMPPKFPQELKVKNISQFNLHYNKKKFDFWIKYFTKRQPARFKRHLILGIRFKKVISKILKEHNLPQDLYYVGLIESGFNTKIRSSANAVGPWQFIKGTAVRYGLRVDGVVDERRSIHKSTEAAAKYFKDLYNIFGSWELALCAYNSGEYRIINAIRRGNSRNYLELVKKKLLPQETVLYVPKIAAAKYINEHLGKFKIKIKSKKNRLYTKSSPLTLKRSFKPEVIRKLIGHSKRSFYLLNPDLKSSFIRVYKKPFNLFISSAAFKNAAKISRYMVRPKK